MTRDDPKALRALAEQWPAYVAIPPADVLALLDRMERAEAEAEAVYRVRMELAQRDHEFCQALGRAEAAEREVERLRAALDEIGDGACSSRYGPGCDDACKRVAYAAMKGGDHG